MTLDAGLGATSEVGRLRTVMLHRPGPELTRLTPRNNDTLLFDGIPWVGRAQEEHDGFAQALRERDVEVLYLTDLLVETLADDEARATAIEATVTSGTTSLRLGDSLRDYFRRALSDLDPQGLMVALTAGVRNDEVRASSLVTSLLGHDEFLIDPLPNLLFTRDSSVWVGDHVAITSLKMPARVRESQLTELIYSRHPRFAGTPRIHGYTYEHVEGGDVLLLAPGVIAVGVGERTTPAGVERLARRVFADGLAHTVLAVPIAQERATMHLDTVATMVDVDKIVMYPNVAHTLTAYAVTAGDGEHLDVASAEPFLEAAAKAMGIDRLHQIDTGLDPVTAEREQWDDGNNTLAIAPRVAVAYERNVETNARLEAAGIEVVAIAGSELGSGRGGPRCMSCPVSREPL
ncbi:arginine deiminase [Nocardioides mangrovicus]|uniref:Arginine deiminase n=1 Tax=Nocardioides mangrovicus TaxID=2478913 RepID=A0A3L8NXT0_9ACTN|nr:arginine deiminase [Nocardioides mangrovicus]RLV48026.1 arginine deiminase [Nocardioides mangrovicus]